MVSGWCMVDTNMVSGGHGARRPWRRACRAWRACRARWVLLPHHYANPGDSRVFLAYFVRAPFGVRAVRGAALGEFSPARNTWHALCIYPVRGAGDTCYAGHGRLAPVGSLTTE